MIQVFLHPDLGPIEFTDNKETIHSAKAKANDISLVKTLNDRQLTAEVKQLIIDDINIGAGFVKAPTEKHTYRK